MRSDWTAALEVARWEFLRYIRPKQQLVGMLVTIVIIVGFMSARRLSEADESEAQDIALIGEEHLPLREVTGPSLRFSTHDAGEETALRAQVADGSLDGLLIVRDTDHAELVLRRSGGWTAELRTALAAARQQHMTLRAGLSADALAAILSPPQLDITHEQRPRGETRGERLALVLILGLMLMSVFIGMGYIFASITGEKQIRVTEQIISAIPAQAWIDGKIIGLIAVSIVGVAAQVVAFGIAFVVMNRVFGSAGLPLPDSLGDPVRVAIIVLFGVLGLFFWFAFLAAVAAMIDDPHNSTRGSLLMVPIMATSLAFFILRDPDSTLAVVLGLLPPTSPSAMPARMLAGDVGPAGITLSLALLAASVFLLRIAAGRVFRLAMLMYGKEPTWAEVRQWIVR
ncbi:MAG TPA: ABC transporter permease [Longimicrobiales bacterium]|nr:ABC transporter permease [Longimicrobiales bacterium]